MKVLLVDGGYTGQPFAQGVEHLIGASVTIAKRNELPTFAVIVKRWVVSEVLQGWGSAGDYGKIARDS